MESCFTERYELTRTCCLCDFPFLKSLMRVYLLDLSLESVDLPTGSPILFIFKSTINPSSSRILLQPFNHLQEALLNSSWFEIQTTGTGTSLCWFYGVRMAAGRHTCCHSRLKTRS